MAIKRLQLTFVLLALVLMLSLLTPLALVPDGRTVTSHALYNQPQVIARAVPVVLGAFVYGIPRPDFYYTVAERRDAIIRASWISPKEDRVVRIAGRFNRHDTVLLLR